MSAWRLRRRAISTSAARALRCTTGCSPASRAVPSCCGSRTPTLRNRPEHAEGIERAMRWLGLDWDEGPYFQSQRGELYEAAIDHLLAKDLAYACDCAPADVAARNKAAGRAARLRRLLPRPGPGADHRAAVPFPHARRRHDVLGRHRPGRGRLRELRYRGLQYPQVQRPAPVHFGQRRRRRRHGHHPRDQG